jgi:hypothetical protein
LCNDTSMKKNTHLEHPEDSLLEGRDSFRQMLNFLREKNSTVSVKYDGAPAIVWGINPENGRFFVGTKSVFNKVKVKINYNHADIENNHGHIPNVASILHMCFECLPKVKGIYQGDFIGWGGGNTFTPNTITYKMIQKVHPESIIFAAHTHYVGDTIKDAEVRFDFPFNVAPPEVYSGRVKEKPFQQDKTHFLNTDATITSRRCRIDYLLNLADLVSNFVRFPDGKKGQELKVAVNKCIREEKSLSHAGMGKRLTFLYELIIHIKHLLMEGISADEEIECYFADEECDHEGYVMTNEFGTFKLINRREFSFRNFTARKSW